jgi:hypothetical protein
VQRLKAEGVSRADMPSRLEALGVSAEDRATLLAALDGLAPPAVPEFTVAPGINPLAPAFFSFSDMGMHGPAHIVGLYWAAFGGVVGIVMLLMNILWEGEVLEAPSGYTVAVSRIAFMAAVFAVVFGLFKMASAVRVRRKP